MCVEVVFQCLIADKSHATDRTFELDALKKLVLDQHRGSKRRLIRNGTYCKSEAGLSNEGTMVVLS